MSEAPVCQWGQLSPLSNMDCFRKQGDPFYMDQQKILDWQLFLLVGCVYHVLCCTTSAAIPFSTMSSTRKWEATLFDHAVTQNPRE